MYIRGQDMKLRLEAKKRERLESSCRPQLENLTTEQTVHLKLVDVSQTLIRLSCSSYQCLGPLC